MEEYELDGSTPKFDFSDDSLILIRLCGLNLKKKYNMTQEAQAAGIMEFLNDNREKYSFTYEKGLGQQAWGAFLNDHPKQAKDKDVRHAAWIWLHQNYPDVVEEIRKTTVRIKGASNPVSAAIHAQINENKPFDENLLEKISGRYILYRFFFLDPSKIMISEINFGCDRGKSEFTVDMVYESLGGKKPRDRVHGYVVPFENQVILQGRFVDMLGPFYAVITDLSLDSRTRKFSTGEGVILAAARGARPSAFPVLIVRMEKSIKLGVYDIDDIKKDKLLWRRLEPVISRGMVDWR